MAKSFPLNNVDTAWYHMEDPTNLMMVTSVVLFKEPLEFDTLKTLLSSRLLKYDRFNMKVVESRLPVGNPRWEWDSNFDLDAHLQHVALPAPGNKKALQEFASHLLSTPLDFSKSPWQVTLVDNYEQGAAVFFRFHHCMADGIAGVKVLFDLTDTSPDAPLERQEDRPQSPHKPADNPLTSLFKPAADALNLGRKVAGTVIQESMEALFNPAQAAEKAQNVAALAARGATTTGRLLLLPPDPQTPFKGKLGVQKFAAWTNPVPLDTIKQASRVLGGKINDVLLSAMAGALRRYLIGRSVDVTDLNLRAAVPVNLRPHARADELGNEFGLVILSLPVGMADPVARMKELKRRMDAIKGSPEALITFGILGILGTSPTQIADQFMNIMGSKATAVASNVPGPREALYFAGKKLDNVMFWVPQSGRLGLGISIFSYDGKVTLGVATDKGLVPDPENILQGFYDEYEALVALIQQVQETVYCQALTKTGRPCKNKAAADSIYCHVHQPNQ